VALVDIGLPGMSGIKGIRALKKSYPGLSLLMLTVCDDDRRIFDALCGLKGFASASSVRYASFLPATPLQEGCLP
jgi:DNA-binding NarL/FixJ family response regulator